jgi:hypothetical protein
MKRSYKIAIAAVASQGTQAGREPTRWDLEPPARLDPRQPQSLAVAGITSG